MRRRHVIQVTTGRRTPSLTSPPSPSFGMGRLKSFFEIIAASTIFLIIMGVPATVFHYTTLSISISLLSYRRILEAGIIPAIIMLLFLSYFLYAERSINISNKKISDLLTFPTIPFLLPAVSLLIISMFSFWSYVFWSFGWLLTKPLFWANIKWKPNNLNLLLLGLSSVLLVLLIVVLIKPKKKTSKDKQLTSKEKLPYSKVRYLPDWLPRDIEEFTKPGSYLKWLRTSILYYIFLPLGVVGGFYFVRITFLFYEFGWPHFITSNLIWIFGLITGPAYAHFMICSTPIPNPSSKEIRLIKKSVKISYGIFILFCIITYSILIYPNLPRSFGGGKPEKVTIWATYDFIPLKKSEIKDSLSPNQKEELIEYPNLLLIDITPTDIIVCSESCPQIKGFAVSRTIVKAISWEH
ncbi:MAG: hypothetical protein ACFFDN_27945 [Candidatus Hodarchaeota archaeon]